MMKKSISILLAILLGLTCFASCGEKPENLEEVQAQFKTQTEDLSEEFFYVNELPSSTNNPEKLLGAADPTVVKVTEGEEAGYYYMYATSLGNGYRCWRSKTLTDWEYVSDAMKIDTKQYWCKHSFWAPGIVYDEEEKLYYLFFSAYNEKFGCLSGGVAVSSSPAGPFVPWTGTNPAGKYSNGQTYEEYEVTAMDTIFDFERLKDVNGTYPYEGAIKVIDLEPFVDPISGKKYMLFCRDLGGKYNTSSIMGMEMINWHTPDWSTLKLLTLNGFNRPVFDQQDKVTIPEGTVNEGAYLNYHDGVYYLTYSCFAYWNKSYQVRQAVATSPLGDFVKVDATDGGMLLYCESDWDFLSGTGHHCFVNTDDGLYMVYHTHVDRKNFEEAGGHRAIAFDKCVYVKNQAGQTILHANGGTYSKQPKLNGDTTLKDITGLVTKVSADKNNNQAHKLIDGAIAVHYEHEYLEYTAEGTVKIKLQLPKNTKLQAIMVYNSYLYDYSFDKIDKIEIKGVLESDATLTKKIYFGENVFFDAAKYISETGNKKNPYLMHPASAAIMQLDEVVLAEEIVITVSQASTSTSLAISEIKLLGYTD